MGLNNNKCKNAAYIREYLPYVQQSFYYMLYLAEEEKRYDPVSVLQAFMKTSEKADYISRGNPRGLNATGKQLYNSIDFTKCRPYAKERSLDVLHWLARVYPYFQFRYDIPFSDIADNMRADEVVKLYNPFHEASVSNACAKLKERFYGPHNRIC